MFGLMMLSGEALPRHTLAEKLRTRTLCEAGEIYDRRRLLHHCLAIFALLTKGLSRIQNRQGLSTHSSA